MPRARLYLIPGYVWHLTHRCHDRCFLLRFKLDREHWLDLMAEAVSRYGLRVLGYAITSNHIHLLVYADGRKEAIPRSMMFAASRTALDYNLRKGRSGAFWEGNYHATAVETGEHFLNCLSYIDLNMVRAGVVGHPADWPYCGFQEIAGRRTTRCLIDRGLLMDLTGASSPERLRSIYLDWIDAALRAGGASLARQPKWTDSVAVGREAFIDRIQGDLGLKVVHREKAEEGDGFVLREAPARYSDRAQGVLCRLPRR